MNKPLSVREREILATACDGALGTPTNKLIVNGFRRVLESEAYWREAVRNHPEGCGDDRVCDFCEVSLDTRSHKPDCTWVLAQVRS